MHNTRAYKCSLKKKKKKNLPKLSLFLFQASILTGDRVWRMPLFEHYTKQVTDCPLADLSNIGKYSR